MAGTPFNLKSVTFAPPFHNEMHNDKGDYHKGSNKVVSGLAEALQKQTKKQHQQQQKAMRQKQQQQQQKQQEGDNDQQQQQQQFPEQLDSRAAAAAVADHLTDPTSPMNDASHGNGVIMWYRHGEGEPEGGWFVELHWHNGQQRVLRFMPVHGMGRAIDTTRIVHGSGECVYIHSTKAGAPTTKGQGACKPGAGHAR
jgi:hypothetical protein